MSQGLNINLPVPSGGLNLSYQLQQNILITQKYDSSAETIFAG